MRLERFETTTSNFGGEEKTAIQINRRDWVKRRGNSSSK
jgi:hypothetical protein